MWRTFSRFAARSPRPACFAAQLSPLASRGPTAAGSSKPSNERSSIKCEKAKRKPRATRRLLRTKDGGIDIVAWRDFPDGLPSKLYLLGQCASGAAYPSKGIKSFLNSFHGDWFTVLPASPPIDALFIPFMLDHDLVPRRNQSLDAARAGHYLSLARDLGVILDRCRIACLVEDGTAIAREKPSLIDRANEFARVRGWVDRVSSAIRGAE